MTFSHLTSILVSLWQDFGQLENTETRERKREREREGTPKAEVNNFDQAAHNGLFHLMSIPPPTDEQFVRGVSQFSFVQGVVLCCTKCPGVVLCCTKCPGGSALLHYMSKGSALLHYMSTGFLR